jgi:hypothetical protein
MLNHIRIHGKMNEIVKRKAETPGDVYEEFAPNCVYQNGATGQRAGAPKTCTKEVGRAKYASE